MLRISRPLAFLAFLFSAVLLSTVCFCAAGDPNTFKDISYKADASTEYERERCKIDLVLPANAKNFPTLIWFHGGGLENGDKADSTASGVVKRFTSEGIAVASVNYRLSPKVHYPAYVEDAAAACAFVREQISKHGGDAERVFVSGHSAGGYLSAMVAVDKRTLAVHGLSSKHFAGFFPISGQMFTHYTVRKERGIDKARPLIDDAAPSFHAAADAPMIICFAGGKDLPTRAEENRYFASAMAAAGAKDVRYIELADRDHGTIASKIPETDDEVARTIIEAIRTAEPATEKIVRLRTTESDTTIAIAAGEKSLLVYNKVAPPVPDGIDPVYARSGFLHPVTSPSGLTITTAYPADHAHQHGIFAAWVDSTYGNQTVDFWNLAKRQGRVEHERTVRIVNEAGRSGFEADLLHRVLGDVDKPVLREHWKVTAVPRSDAVCFEIETRQEALTDQPLVIKKYHYGGMAYRGPVSWLTDKDGDKLTAALKREPSSMFNSEGQDRIAGNHAHARWVAVTGEIEGHAVTIAVFDDPSNFRAPQASRLHPTKPYFCFSPCVDGEFTIDREHPFQSRYRFMVFDKRPEPSDIEREWRQWTLR